jgi:hypothetical protein
MIPAVSPMLSIYLAIKFRSKQEIGEVGEVKSKVVTLRIMTACGEWRNNSTHS